MKNRSFSEHIRIYHGEFQKTNVLIPGGAMGVTLYSKGPFMCVKEDMGGVQAGGVQNVKSILTLR